MLHTSGQVSSSPVEASTTRFEVEPSEARTERQTTFQPWVGCCSCHTTRKRSVSATLPMAGSSPLSGMLVSSKSVEPSGPPAASSRWAQMSLSVSEYQRCQASRYVPLLSS